MKLSKKLQQELQKSGVTIAASTLIRYLKKMGLVSRCTRWKPLLTQRHRSLRLAFATKFAMKDPKFWRLVLFTDETRTAVRNDCSRTRVRRKTGEQLNLITPTVKHPTAVMLGEPLLLLLLATSFPRYRRTLQQHLIPKSSKPAGEVVCQ